MQPQTEQTTGELRAQIMALQAQLKEMPKGISMKVSLKGAVSVYGLGRFPVTLYSSQWIRLLNNASEIQKFLVDNESSLKTK